MIKKGFLRFIIAVILIFYFSFPSYSFSGTYPQNRNITAGIYLRIPFGPTKRNDDRLKYGLRLNMSQQFDNSPRWNGASPFESRQYINMDLMSLNFSEQGFRDLSFAGRQAFVYQDGLLKFAGGKGKKGGTNIIIWMFAGIGAAILVAVAVNQATQDNNNNFRPK